MSHDRPPSDRRRASDGAPTASGHGSGNPVARASYPEYTARHATQAGLRYLFVPRWGRGSLADRDGQHCTVIGPAGTNFGLPQSRVRFEDGLSAIVLNEELAGRGTR
jgi:hypothetical protein